MRSGSQISIENSLYAHSKLLIDEFNALIVKHEHPLYDVVSYKAICECEDFLNSVFSYWVQLIETKELRVPKVDKLIFHTFTFEMNKILLENATTRKFLEKKRRNEEIFVYTYFFTNNILNYMYEHMPKELRQRVSQDKELITLYATNDSDFQNELLQSIYAYRKDFLADIRGNMQVRFNIQAIINEAFYQTERYFEMHP